jgi:hypothetical protein
MLQGNLDKFSGEKEAIDQELDNALAEIDAEIATQRAAVQRAKDLRDSLRP